MPRVMVRRHAAVIALGVILLRCWNIRLTHARLALAIEDERINAVFQLAHRIFSFQRSTFPDSQVFAGALVGVAELALRCWLYAMLGAEDDGVSELPRVNNTAPAQRDGIKVFR